MCRPSFSEEQLEQLNELTDQLIVMKKDLQHSKEECARLADADRQAQHWRDELDAMRDSVDRLQRVENENRQLRDRLIDFKYWKELEAEQEKLMVGNTEASVNAAHLETVQRRLESDLERALQQISDLEQQRESNIKSIQMLREEVVGLKLELHNCSLFKKKRISCISMDDETSLDLSSASDPPLAARNLASQLYEEKIKRLEQENESLRSQETTRNSECDYTKRLSELESKFLVDQAELETRCLHLEQEVRKFKRSLREEISLREETAARVTSTEASLGREREKHKLALESAEQRASAAEEAQDNLYEQLSSTRKNVLALREELIQQHVFVFLAGLIHDALF
ncbi:hypothetical protein Ciccas_004568 [Cichlidogyrus casuarinus]|uniref:Uncharacterized protein n=1 Tax=Cichlidogyrus casuarinus TaxID=1844966 RepID=A0ABD2QB83_9PLAT